MNKKIKNISIAAISILLAASNVCGAESNKKTQETNATVTEGVWQKHFASPRAAKDATMVLNTDAEPDTTKGFKPLFDQTGNDAQILGGTADYKFIDGELVARSVPKNKKNSFYCTKKNYAGNFILTFEWRWGNDVKGNSGVMIHSGMNTKKGVLAGIQVEIEQDMTRGWTAGVFGEGVTGWLYSLSREDHAAARSSVKDLKAWNKMTIEYKDGVIKTWSNGVPCANQKWSKANDKKRRDMGSPNEDVIGFQVHVGAPGSEIRFKDIRIKEL